MQGQTDGESGVDNEMAELGFAGFGAWILGRNTASACFYLAEGEPKGTQLFVRWVEVDGPASQITHAIEAQTESPLPFRCSWQTRTPCRFPCRRNLRTRNGPRRRDTSRLIHDELVQEVFETAGREGDRNHSALKASSRVGP